LIPRISKIFQNRMGWTQEKTEQEEKILADHMSPNSHGVTKSSNLAH